jgi:hypothetical protein
LRGNSQSGLVLGKYRNRTTISNNERVNERLAEHFDNFLTRDRVKKIIEEKEKVYDILDAKEDLFCEEELATLLRRLKNNKATGAYSTSALYENNIAAVQVGNDVNTCFRIKSQE